MAKIRLKKKVKKILLLLIVGIILLSTSAFLYKDYKYKQSYEYKLLQISYSKEEINNILKKLDSQKIEELLQKNYISYLSDILNEKYYLAKNLDRYLAYQEKNPNSLISDTISLVNTKRDYDFYQETCKTDISKGNLMLVNKYNLLDKDYNPDDLKDVSATYAYAGNKLKKQAYEAFKKLANDAKKDGNTIVILSSYRTYEYQESLWNKRKDDNYVARAGASEHETGLSIDVADFYDKNDSFKDTESYIWMLNNAHKYGFILRYPEGKENITGYKFEAWHYRYLGVDMATKVYNEGITYDEYYAYYLDN